MLSGDAIAGLPLGRAPIARVDPLLARRLGSRAEVGQPQLCQSATARDQLAVVDHSWPGVTVRYGSTGGAAVAIAWVVDLDRVPDGVQLAGDLPWRPPFSSLGARAGVQLTTEDGRQIARLTRQGLTYSGPAGAGRPDTLAGGPQLTCG